MFWLLTLTRTGRRPLFADDLDPILFLDRFQQLGDRWHVALRAFVVRGQEARLLVAGPERAVAQVCRLQQSGWGVWRHHRGDFVSWSPAVREWIADERHARQTADHLHQNAGLAWPWSSLREALVLRHPGWVDGAWLRCGRSATSVLQAARLPGPAPASVPVSWRAREALPWAVVEGTLRHVTGRDSTRRRQRVLRTQLAWSAGWSPAGIADRLDVQPRSVARSLRTRGEFGWDLGRVVLQDRRLRPSWLPPADQWATAPGPEVPCPATQPSSRVLVG